MGTATFPGLGRHHNRNVVRWVMGLGVRDVLSGRWCDECASRVRGRLTSHAKRHQLAWSRDFARAYEIEPAPRLSGAAKSRARRAERRAEVRDLWARGWRPEDGMWVQRDADGKARGWILGIGRLTPWPGLREVRRGE